MHILLSCMYDSGSTSENFTIAIVMLRFMVLRDRSEQFSAVIQRVIGDNVKLENSAKVFNMFSRIGRQRKTESSLQFIEEESKEAQQLQTISKLLTLKVPSSMLKQRCLQAEME
jgi:hypothetical protein